MSDSLDITITKDSRSSQIFQVASKLAVHRDNRATIGEIQARPMSTYDKNMLGLRSKQSWEQPLLKKVGNCKNPFQF